MCLSDGERISQPIELMTLPAYNAIVDAAQHQDSPFAAPPIFRTIQAAMDFAPSHCKTPFVIYIRAGRYREKILVTKPNITFLGESREASILTFDDYSGIKDCDGKSIGTWRCATLIIRAPDFKAINLSVENAFDYLANDIKPLSDPTRTNEPQAVALMTDQGADRTYLKNVKLMGYQDTLFTLSGRSYIEDSLIAGNIDFIFGAGQTLICRSDIITRPRGLVIPGEMIGYVTAPSTPFVEKYGLTLMNCRLMKENDQVPPGSCPLGRPWHPTTTFPDGRYADPNAVGVAIFINCWMDDHITETGWDKMHGTSRQSGEKDWYHPDNPNHARFAEYGSDGPGAHNNNHRPQLSIQEMESYRSDRILRGWLPTRSE